MVGVSLLLGILSGCTEVKYYAQAVRGHLRVLERKQPIEELLKSPQSPPELVRKLKLIQEVRRFAIEKLQLPDVQSYTEYADLGRSYVSAVVTAAPALKLQAKEWCFLFVGCVSYRGYFEEAEAKAYAARLQQEGFDTNVGYVRAYSTLKWLNNSLVPNYFRDPVLNTFLERSEVNIIKTLIHEMAHQVLFVAGDTAFNESFAVFVEQEGVRRYLEQTEGLNSSSFQRYLQSKQESVLFLEILATTARKLETLYHSDRPTSEKLAQKRVLFEELKAEYRRRAKEFRVQSYQGFFEQELNNSHLLGIRQYHSYVDAFGVIFREEGERWADFFERAKKLSALSKEERTALLEAKQAHLSPEARIPVSH